MDNSDQSAVQRPSQSTESYKGVRDFYPEDLFVQDFMFDACRKVVERYGYSEYGASVLEPSELYRAKTGDEIVNEQTYSFVDRGGRDVTLRPEMTPTVARMVAARRRDLAFPLRWYSIPNLFRYERPQKGRLREHWQLNVDIFGVKSLDAEAEIISIAHDLLTSFGAGESDFEIRISSRKILDAVYAGLGFDAERSHEISKLIDKKAKMPRGEFSRALGELAGDKAAELESLLEDSSGSQLVNESEGRGDVAEIMGLLEETGIGNARFDLTLMRGFDYYTGIVFELFDTNPENSRSLFGGGRYDDLLSIFGSDKVPAVGFGMGDVTLRDFLVVRGLVPPYKPTAELYVCVVDEDSLPHAMELARELRSEPQSLNVAVDLSGKKVSDQIRKAERDSIPYVLFVGQDEISSGTYKVRNLATREEQAVGRNGIAAIVRS